MIRVENISKSYTDTKALKNVSFSISKGEIVGFLGPNGAGKSTMMKIMNSYIEADSGLLEIGGKSITKDSIDIKALVGYLPENNPLYPEMYVREYLEFVADVYKIHKSEIDSVIDRTGLSKESSKKISELSKGYKQRVGLAAAIIHDPDYLILDEPTTGLDPNQILEIRKLIKGFAKEKTVLLSTHIMQEVEAMCDRVIIINRGELVKDQMLQDFNTGNDLSCLVKFDKSIHSSKIEEIEGVESITTEDNITFTIRFKNPDILDQLLKVSNETGNSIVSFSKNRMSLEESFRQLTSNK